MVGGASSKAGPLELRGLQVEDVTQGMLPAGRHVLPGVCGGGGGGRKETLRGHLGTKRSAVDGEEPSEGAMGSVEGRGCQEKAGLLWATAGCPGESPESLSGQKGKRRVGEGKRSPQVPSWALGPDAPSYPQWQHGPDSQSRS